MTPFSFIHAADLHLDTPFEGVGQGSADLQEKLKNASLTAFDNLVQQAIDERVDFVLMAGDIYDGLERGTRAQGRFLRGLRTLDQHGIYVLFVHGNHDPIGEGWSALRPEDFPKRAILFDQSDAVRQVPVIRGDQTLAVVHGISHRNRKENRNLSREFPAANEDGLFHIGLLHANVGGLAGHDDYAPCVLADLCARGMDYWALGHIHARQMLRRAHPTIVYPGNLQARSFQECGPKGATLVRVEASGQVELKELVLDVVRFLEIEVDVSACGSFEEAVRAAVLEVEKSRATAEGRFVLARLRLSGPTVIHRDLLMALDQDELLPRLRDDLPPAHVWIDRVTVATLPRVDRAQLASSAGFEGALVRLTDELGASEEKLVAFLAEVQAPLLTGTRFRSYCEAVSLAELKDQIRQAEARILSELQS
jgi:DNA repair exonuclease SbcCD nuclease subunit